LQFGAYIGRMYSLNWCLSTMLSFRSKSSIHSFGKVFAL
jgi:hypothetical protein